MKKKDIIIKAKPFIKWVGGKTQLIHRIEKALPKYYLKLDNLTYIEPFVGGGAVLFWILQKYPRIEKAIINDINSDLTNAYTTIRNSPSELVELLKVIQDEYLSLSEGKRKDYYLNKRARFNTKTLDLIENTALFIFLNRTCFNGLYRVNSKGLFNVPFGRYTNPKICDEQTIFTDSELLQKVEILTGDFEGTLKYASNNSFFYLDPPYKPLSETSSFNSYSKEVFDDAEQIRLGNFCKKIDKLGHSFILSNSDVKGKNPNDDFFERLYESFSIERVFATRMVNANAEKRGKLTELLVSNSREIDYIPALRFNKNDLFVKNYDKPYWVPKDKIRIDDIKIDMSLFSYNNDISYSCVNRIVTEFDLIWWIPVTVNKDFFLLDGKHRLEAAKKMNLKYIDVVIQDTELLESTKSTKPYKTRKFIL